MVVDPELAGGHAWGTNTENYWHPTAEHEEEQDAARMLGWWGCELEQGQEHEQEQDRQQQHSEAC